MNLTENSESKQDIPEIYSNIIVDGVSYLVKTVDVGKSRALIVTAVYLNGVELKAEKAGYAHLLAGRASEGKIRKFMQDCHDSVIQEFIAENTRNRKKRPEYFKEANGFLRKGDGRAAHRVLREALEAYPGDPFLLSYYGCLTAVVEQNATEGIRICKEALRRLRESLPFGNDKFYPVFYLNLGRAYLAGMDKVEAIKSFKRGLSIDPKNKDLIAELRKLGVRQSPPLTFLRRDNPINKYIGLMLRRGLKLKSTG